MRTPISIRTPAVHTRTTTVSVIKTHEVQVPFASHPPLAGKRFIDACAGIGGAHLGLASQGAHCVAAIEINPAARETYAANFGTHIPIFHDLRKLDPGVLPDAEILFGGFACQPFSVAGEQLGFDDPENGSLLSHLLRIIEAKQPELVLLENVLGFATHNEGRSADHALDALAELGYDVSLELLDAADFGLPQQRKRIFVAGIRLDLMDGENSFLFPNGTDRSRVIEDILESKVKPDLKISAMTATAKWPTERSESPVQLGTIGNDSMQGYRVYSAKGKGITLCASSGGPGSQTGLYLVGRGIRKLTSRECARMQGFPESFKPHHSATQARKQFGNAVAVPVVSAIAVNLFAAMKVTEKASWPGLPAANDELMSDIIDGKLASREAIHLLDAAAAISADDRKKNGLGTTPAAVADTLTSMAFPASGLPSSLLDPACGRGSLLLAVVEEAARRTGSWTDAARWAEKSLFGCDIDPNAVADCRRILKATFLEQGINVDLDNNLRQDNFLLPQGGGHHPFTDRIVQFDAMISNPPYVSIKHIPEAMRSSIRAAFVSCRKGNFDLYYAFIERSLTLAGRVAVVTPSSWLTNTSAASLRGLATDRVSSIVDMGHERLFDGLSTYVALSSFEPQATQTLTYARDLPAKDKPLPFTLCNKSNLGRQPWFLDPAAQQANGKKTVGDMAEVLGGLCTQADDVFLFTGERNGDGTIKAEFKDKKTTVVEAGISVPHLKLTKICSTEEVRCNRAMSLLPYDDDGAAHDAKTMRCFPKAMKWLHSQKDKLMACGCSKGLDKKLFVYGRKQGIYPSFNDDDILIGLPAMAQGGLMPVRLDLGDIGGKRFTWTNGYVLKCRDEAAANKLEAWLSTAEAWRIIAARGKPFSGGWVGISTNLLRSLVVGEIVESERVAASQAANDEQYARYA